MNNSSIKEIAELIKNAKKPLFISHEHPDGDTYGASFGLRSGMGKQKHPIACASKIEWPFTELGIVNTISDIGEDEHDLYVFLDCADEFRCGNGIKDKLRDDVKSINIDHHQSNTYYADYNYVEERSSTCEIVFDILMEHKSTMSKETADYLYMGVASDTGLFVHGYTTPQTHYTAGKLMEFGADFERIGKLMFMTVSQDTAFLTGKLFNNLEIVDKRIAVSYITIDDFKSTNTDYKDSEGLINHLTSIDKIDICILLKQQEAGTFKASLRSTRDYDISKLAIANGGGGHKQAAGCKFQGDDVEEIKKDIFKQIAELEII
ncbi:MAG: bifunctional oligoribonuclease/PAP phosphatase NrnA [Eubacteriales bacterium]